MKTLLLILLLQPITRAQREDRPVYGPAKSLIGVMRSWNPERFYPLHESMHTFINKYDRDLLNTPWRLDSFLRFRGHVWVRVNDTAFLPKIK